MTENYDDAKSAREFVQKERARQILQARENVKEQKNKALDKEASGEISPLMAKTIYREAVEEYIEETEDAIWESDRTVIYNDQEIDVFTYYWEKIPLGEFPIPGVGVIREYYGLASYIHEDRFITKEVTETKNDIVEGKTTESETLRFQIPWEISKAAYRACKEFWAKHYLEFDISSNQRPLVEFEELGEETWQKE